MIIIRTAKDPKVKQTIVGKKGVIEIPQSTGEKWKPIIGAASGAASGVQSGAEIGASKGSDEGEEDKSSTAREELNSTGDMGGLRSASGSLGSGDLNDGLGSGMGQGGNFSSGPATGAGLGGGTPSFFLGGLPVTTTTTPTSADDTDNDDGVSTPVLPTAELQAFLDSSVSDDGVPGVIMAVETKTGVWIGAAGKADLGNADMQQSPESMTTNMQVRLAGVTKLFTAALIMKLVEEGKIALDDIVDKWLPFEVIAGNQITVEMLLNHTSGLHDHTTTPEFFDSLLWGPTIPWTSYDILTITDSYMPDFDPGTAFQYCNTGYYVLGMIAEAATGDTVENLIKTKFFDPLNMSRTALTPSGLTTAPAPRNYCWFGVPDYPTLTDTSEWDFSFDWTSGSGVSTAQDMLTWTHALFGNKVVSSQSLTQMITPQAPSTMYGFGIEVWDADPWFGEKMYGHGGENPGVLARWLYYPDSGRTIFIALNRSDRADVPQVDASQVADAILTGVTGILVDTQTQ